MKLNDITFADFSDADLNQLETWIQLERKNRNKERIKECCKTITAAFEKIPSNGQYTFYCPSCEKTIDLDEIINQINTDWLY